jgi:tRNA G18 (ribose-2'-O)-methylase SpoU
LWENYQRLWISVAWKLTFLRELAGSISIPFLSFTLMTSTREQRIHDVLRKRQFDIAVVLENVWDPHNISAVLRSCDATGIQDVYIISPETKKNQNLEENHLRVRASGSAYIIIPMLKSALPY